MAEPLTLTEIERGEESCILRFSDGESFRVEYLAIRTRCQCAKCKPRQENEQRRIEFNEEVSRLVLEKPMVELVGHYGITMIWPSGCSSGIHSFSHLRNISEDLGTKI
ncbi:MAG: hypothetical protein CMB08_06735 [Euryarchaeota archaeon]|nr:hypothetical protein [Euryarchaeota archaeon]|tara:strand:- start:503 stop:826 length:324 start_codon:yes stop_codon:yes gene_type:complete